MATLEFILKILGSLGVFLYGMKVMSEGIQRTAGDRMRKIMATMTHNRVAGVVTGVTTTGLLQSSSATTVMVVSFVNAGLLTLVESIGIIMGANLGTTLTAWIIALIGKFSLSAVALPIIGVGLPVFFIFKGRVKSIGEVLIGFGLLFYGLHLLKSSVPDMHGMLHSVDPVMKAKAEAIQIWIEKLSGHGFGSILIFLFAGIVLTLIVQSSSAAMAITVTLAIQGWIGFPESAAIVLGENIGTTVTAWLASLGTNVNARRAARAHFLFNVLGVIWMLLVFGWFLQGVVALAEFLPASLRTGKVETELGFRLAIFHSLFNLTNIFLLIWFVPQIARLVSCWIKEPVEEAFEPRRLRFITQGMLDVGELNIPEAEKATKELAGITREMFQGFLVFFEKAGIDTNRGVERLKELEDETDVLTHDITEYLVRTSASELSPVNARSVARMLRIVSELEEIGDVIFRLVQISKRRHTKNWILSQEGNEGVLELAALIRQMINLYCQVLDVEPSEEQFLSAKQLEESIKKVRKRQNKLATKRMRSPEFEVKAEMLTIDLNNQLEMIGNHGLNVVRTTYFDLFEDEVPSKYEEV